MADNKTLKDGSNTDFTVATDQIAGVDFQEVKLAFGAKDTATYVSSTNPMPARDSDGTSQITHDTAGADDESNNKIRKPVTAWLKGYSGTTWDRLRTAIVGATSTFTGLLNVIPLARYNATPPSLSDGQAVMHQLDSAGNLKVNLSAGGFATSAKQDTIIGHVDGIEGLLTTIDGDTGTLAGAVSGSEMQCDIVASLPAGDNNIGNVDLASAIPAGTNLIGRVSSSAETSTVYNGTTALTPKFAIIDAATSGDNTILEAVASKKIRVLAAFLISAGTVTVRFESGAGGTALTGQMNLVANSGFNLPYCPTGWFETASNTLLNLELSGAVSVDGCLVYVEV